MARLADSAYRVDQQLLGEADYEADEDAKLSSAATGTGTFASSVFMVFNSAVGTGILTLPYAFLTAGWIGGCLILVIYMLVEFATIRAIIECTAASDSRGYPDVVRHFLGPRWGTVFSGVIATYCFFAATGAFIIVKNVMTPLLMLASHNATPFWTSDYVQVATAGVIVFPLLCLRNITSLRFTAMLSFSAIIFVVIVVVTQFFSRPPADAGLVGPFDAWGAWPSIVLAVPNVMLSLQAHIQVPSIYADMRPDLRSVGRMTGAVAVAYLLIGLLYSTMAVFGLATFHRATRPNIMECDYVASDPPIIVARICLALTAVFSVPVNHHPAREAVWSVLSGGSRQEMPTRVFFGETIVFFGLALLLGMFIKELSTLNDLMGLTAGVAVIFVLPGCFLWRATAATSSSRNVQAPLQPSHAALSQGRGAAAVFLVVALLSFVLCVHSFIGSEFLGVAPRPTADKMPNATFASLDLN